MKKRLLVLAALAAGAATAADVGDIVATSASFVFRINSNAPKEWNYAEDNVASFLVTWRKGETVSVTAQDGVTKAEGYPSSAAASSGGVQFSPSAEGVWTLVNSESGTAHITVPAGIVTYEMGAMVVETSIEQLFGLNTVQSGPDRMGTKRDLISTAFSGDDWVGANNMACTLKFTSPDGVVTEVEKTGTGVHSFTFTKSGMWTVELVVEDMTVRTAHINAVSGLTIIFR